MEKIKFGDWETLFPIESIQPVAVHILRIIFTDVMPNDNGYSKPITIFSQGGIEEGTLEGWNTIYYKDTENKTVYLSDDGSVYTAPEEPQTSEPDNPEPYEPTVEELQDSKIAAMKSASASAIAAGIDVNGEHFSLDSEAQMALLVRQIEIITAVEYIDFYPDGEQSKYYTADEMQDIIDAANEFIDYHEVYCNELCLWIKTLTDKDEIEAVYYGMDIPEEYQSPVMKDLVLHSKDETKDEEEEPDDDDSDTDGESFDGDGKKGFD